MYGNEREKEIMNLLEENNYVTVDYLAEKIHISPSSIRRDLKRLEMKGLILRSYGGAELKASVNKQIPFNLRSHQNSREKSIVARCAASMVKAGDVIFLDCSTSTYFMLEYLKNISDITVITNSLAGMNACSEHNISAFLTGGRLSDENPSCLVGNAAEEMIKTFHADFCFFSVQSLSKDGGLYDCFEKEIAPRRLMMENSEKRVFLCDHSKINHYSAYRLCSLDDVDYVISDMNMEEYLDLDESEIISDKADKADKSKNTDKSDKNGDSKSDKTEDTKNDITKNGKYIKAV